MGPACSSSCDCIAGKSACQRAGVPMSYRPRHFFGLLRLPMLPVQVRQPVGRWDKPVLACRFRPFGRQPVITRLPRGTKVEVGIRLFPCPLILKIETAHFPAKLVVRYIYIRSEEHTSELQSLLRLSSAVF